MFYFLLIQKLHVMCWNMRVIKVFIKVPGALTTSPTFSATTTVFVQHWQNSCRIIDKSICEQWKLHFWLCLLWPGFKGVPLVCSKGHYCHLQDVKEHKRERGRRWRFSSCSGHRSISISEYSLVSFKDRTQGRSLSSKQIQIHNVASRIWWWVISSSACSQHPHQAVPGINDNSMPLMIRILFMTMMKWVEVEGTAACRGSRRSRGDKARSAILYKFSVDFYCESPRNFPHFEVY